MNPLVLLLGALWLTKQQANQPSPATKSVHRVRLRAGHTYRFKAQFIKSNKPLTPALLEEIKRGFTLAGVVDFVIHQGPPVVVEYTQTVSGDRDLPIGSDFPLSFADLTITIRWLSAVELVEPGV